LKKTAKRLAFDTNAIIYLVEQVEPYSRWLRSLFASVESRDRSAVVSVVTEAEALVKPLRSRDRSSVDRMRFFFAGAGVEVVDTSRVIAVEAARLRADLEIDLLDAIIVATALVEGCDALVGNDARCAKRVTQIPYIYLDDAVKTT
jgi:predicted nucleic acid-binding protein